MTHTFQKILHGYHSNKPSDRWLNQKEMGQHARELREFLSDFRDLVEERDALLAWKADADKRATDGLWPEPDVV